MTSASNTAACPMGYLYDPQADMTAGNLEIGGPMPTWS